MNQMVVNLDELEAAARLVERPIDTSMKDRHRRYGTPIVDSVIDLF
jgi:hypothetical protein